MKGKDLSPHNRFSHQAFDIFHVCNDPLFVKDTDHLLFAQLNKTISRGKSLQGTPHPRAIWQDLSNYKAHGGALWDLVTRTAWGGCDSQEPSAGQMGWESPSEPGSEPSPESPEPPNTCCHGRTRGEQGGGRKVELLGAEPTGLSRTEQR